MSAQMLVASSEIGSAAVWSKNSMPLKTRDICQVGFEGGMTTLRRDLLCDVTSYDQNIRTK
jgi:hypothetical protein